VNAQVDPGAYHNLCLVSANAWLSVCCAGAGGALFRLLQSLPRQLLPDSLSVLHCLELDVFPDRPGDWCLLAHLPCLRQLLLPPFKPALPHEHLPALAQLTQLTGLTLSVQVGQLGPFVDNLGVFEHSRELGALGDRLEM